MVAFGLANIAAVVPLTPGCPGEGIYVPTLIGFGLTRVAATLGVALYRLAQHVFPVVIGGGLLWLRVGPGRIERRDRVNELRQITSHSRPSGSGPTTVRVPRPRDAQQA